MPRGRRTSGRLPIALSATALVVALFGSTPIGEAAKQPIVSFAKRAGFAGNAGKVNGIQASRTAKPGLLLALGKDGRFPAAVVPAGAAGSTGPAGPTGDKGEKGDKGDAGAQGAPGVSGRELVTKSSPLDSAAEKSAFAACPAGKKAIGGGAGISGAGTAGPALTWSAPGGQDTGWLVHAEEIGTYNSSWGITAIAVCATVVPQP